MDKYFKQPFVSAVYFDRTFNRHAVKIGPGEYHVSDRDIFIVTVLGSCVSVCIRDPEKLVGGMNHFMLPAPAAGAAPTPVSDTARYGAFAMELLINQVLKMGGVRTNLEVKIFGGGKILEGMSDIGRLNVEFAMRYLQTEELRIFASDTGGIYPRKIYYSPISGKVYLRQMKSLHDDRVAQAEKAYLERLKKLVVRGDVELF